MHGMWNHFESKVAHGLHFPNTTRWRKCDKNIGCHVFNYE